MLVKAITNALFRIQSRRNNGGEGRVPRTSQSSLSLGVSSFMQATFIPIVQTQPPESIHQKPQASGNVIRTCSIWSRFRGEIVIEVVFGYKRLRIIWQSVFPEPVPESMVQSSPCAVAFDASSWYCRGIICLLLTMKTRIQARRAIVL